MASINPFPPKKLGKPPGKAKGSYILEGIPSNLYCAELFNCVKSIIKSMKFKWWDDLADKATPLPRYHMTIATGKSSLEIDANKKADKEKLIKENTEYAQEIKLLLDNSGKITSLKPISIEISKNGWVILNFASSRKEDDELNRLQKEAVRFGQARNIQFKEDEIGSHFKLHMSIGHIFYLMPDVRQIPGYTLLKDQKSKNKKRDEVRTQCIAAASEKAKKDLLEKQKQIMQKFQALRVLDLERMVFSYNARDESLSTNKPLAMKKLDTLNTHLNTDLDTDLDTDQVAKIAALIIERIVKNKPDSKKGEKNTSKKTQKQNSGVVSPGLVASYLS